MEAKNRHYYLFVFVLGMITISIVLLQVSFSQKKNRPLSISFLDVGQGDATFIEAPNGAQILIDGGPLDGGILEDLSKVMPFFDYSIDVVLATHADADHIGGLPSVIERYDISNIIQNGQLGDTQLFKQLQSAIDQSEKNTKTKTFIARRGDVIVLDKEHGVFLFALHPNGYSFAKDTNDNSIILKLVYGDSSVILTGDTPSSVEKMLVYKDGTYLKSDILKAGHHGSKTSSSEEFIKVVSASTSVVSAGRDNRYGHPHQDVLERLQGVSTVFQTAVSGTIRFESRGDVFIPDNHKEGGI
jgi:competence protein ComEC